MSWEWFGDLKELNGNPGTITSQHTWDWLIDALNDGTWYTPADTGEYLSAGSGDYYFGGGDTITKTTSYGLTLTMSDSRVLASGGGLDFITNIPVPGTSGGYYGFSLGGLMYYGGFRIAVDHSAEEALIMLVRVFQNGPYYTTYDWLGQYSDHTARNVIYNFIMSNAPSIYNWTSVPSVIGKNGTIPLAQIASESINDGEPVSDAAATAFSDLPAECNVGEIIDELLPYEESLVDVLVKYKVKGAVTGTFDYVKLVAKKGSIPKSVEDGDKVVDIDPSKKSKLVTGLDEGSKYYFVIFIKDSEDQTAKSNEMWIITGAIPIPTDLRPYVDKLRSVLWGLNDSNTLLGYLDTTGNSNYWVLDDIYSYAVSGNFNSNGNQYYFYVLTYCAIHVTSGENSVSVSYNYAIAPYNVIHTWGRGMFGPYDHSGNSGNYIETRGDSTGINFYSPYNVDDIGFTLTTSFETMLECFTYLATHFRRIRNLYVDGVPWIDYGESVNKTMYELAKTHDLTSMQINNIGGSTLTDHTVDSLSSYFGTVNILVAERENGNHINAYDGNNASGRFTIAMTEAMSYIPITHCLIKSFTFKGKLTPYGTQWDQFWVQTGFINGSTIKTNGGISYNGSSDWSDYALTYEIPVIADYIIIGGNDGQWEIKDFVAETVVYEE